MGWWDSEVSGLDFCMWFGVFQHSWSFRSRCYEMGCGEGMGCRNWLCLVCSKGSCRRIVPFSFVMNATNLPEPTMHT